MTIYNQGDAQLVPYPFTDQSETKQRPAIVLSGAAYNQGPRCHPRANHKSDNLLKG